MLHSSKKLIYVWLDEFQPVQDVTVVRLGRSSPRDRTTPNPFYLLDGSDSGKRRLLNPFVSWVITACSRVWQFQALTTTTTRSLWEVTKSWDHRRDDQTNLPKQSCRQLQFPVTFISVFRVFCTFSGRMDTCTVHPINPTSNIDKLLWCLLVEVFFKIFFPQQGKNISKHDWSLLSAMHCNATPKSWNVVRTVLNY